MSVRPGENGVVFGEISVSDPRRVVDPRISITPHVAYSVRDTNYGPLVERRYSDFLWLVERLEESFPGVIIPPLPPKNSLERFDEDFIEARRVRLEKFLNNVTRHAKLRKSAHVEAFIRFHDTAFSEERSVSIPSLVGKATSWLGNVISSHTANMKPVETTKTETDILFEGISIYVDCLHKHAVDINQQIHLFVGSNIDQTRHMRAFAEALNHLESNEDNLQLSSCLADSSMSMRKLSDHYESYARAQLNDLQYPFEEYVGLLESVQRALKRRAGLRKRFDWAKEQVEVQNAKLLRSSRSDPQQEELRKMELRLAMEEDKLVTTTLSTVSDDLISEYKLFKETRVDELMRLFADFAKLQVNFAKNAESCSRALVSKVTISVPLPPEPQNERLKRNAANRSSNSAIMSEEDDDRDPNTSDYNSLPPARPR